MADLELNINLSEEEFKKRMEEIKKSILEAGKVTEETSRKIGNLIHVQAGELKRLAIPYKELTQEKQTELWKNFIELAKKENEGWKKYTDYLQKKDKLIKEHDEKVAKASTMGERKLAEANRENAIRTFDAGNAKPAFSLGSVMSEMYDQSKTELKDALKQAEAIVKFAEGKKWDKETGDKLGITEEKFKTLVTDAELDKVKKKVKELRAEITKYNNAFQSVGQGFGKLFSSAGDPREFQEGLTQVTAGLTAVKEAGALVSQTFSMIGESFGSEDMSDVSKGINVATDALGAAASGAKTGMAVAGPWGAAAGAAIGMATSLTSSFAKLHDARHEKKIKKIEEQVKVLEGTYKELGRSIEKAFSSDASKLIGDQNKLLEQQKILIQQQIKEEKSKKKTDNSRVKEWEKELKQIDQTIQDNRDKAVDAIFGADVKTAIDNFAQAYVDAWAAGNDKAKSSKDFVKGMIKQMIIEAMKSDISGPMEALRKKLKEFWENDGIIDANEEAIINSIAENMGNGLDGKYGWADRFMGKSDGSSSQGTSSKGFETMTQETASELNGRFTALQFASEEIKNLTGLIQLDVLELRNLGVSANESLLDLRDIGLDSVSHLEKISKNTAQLTTVNEKLDMVIKNTENL